MAFRNLMIESPARISVRNNQLVIYTDKEHTIAIEDISSILLESRQSTITTAALSQLGKFGCAVFMCDDQHMPCAILTPFHQYVRQLVSVKRQLAVTEPRKKQLWRDIVKRKIHNQALCLKFANMLNEADKLFNMAARVRSGDSNNIEAVAAQYYFPVLFGNGFTRNDKTTINAGLNYGYSILRGCIARTLSVYGFMPSLGLHHHSGLNQFNLADDLIEPFRPLIDLTVYRKIKMDEKFSSSYKKMLFNCLNLDILTNEQIHNVKHAIELAVQSLEKAIEDKNSNLKLPTLLDLQ